MRDLNDYRREEKREETMKDERMENNKACVTGRITSGFSYSHEIFGERFFRADILAQRASGVADTIPLMFSEELADVEMDYSDSVVEVV